MHEKIIVDTTVDEAVSFGGVVNGTILYITTSQPITIKINGSAVALPINSHLFLTGNVTTPLTALLISNSSGLDANVKIVIGG